MDRNEIRDLALTLQEGDEVEVGVTWGNQKERRASGVLYKHAGDLRFFGCGIRWDNSEVNRYLTYLRVITRAPIPEPTLLGTVVVTDDGRHYVLAHPGDLNRRWFGPEFAPGLAMWMRWGDLKNPRVLTPAEVASLPKAEVD